MSDKTPSTERSRNLWAPWRMEYINALDDAEADCFLCRYRDEPDADRENLVLWRGQRCFVVLNRFPYTGGHSMVAPYPHVGGLGELDDETLPEIFTFLRDLQHILADSFQAQGFNIGMNLGHCAGAGLPGHLHVHMVPRWSGDTNFMTVLGGVRVIPQSLEVAYDQLLDAGKRLGLPTSRQ